MSDVLHPCQPNTLGQLTERTTSIISGYVREGLQLVAASITQTASQFIHVITSYIITQSGIQHRGVYPVKINQPTLSQILATSQKGVHFLSESFGIGQITWKLILTPQNNSLVQLSFQPIGFPSSWRSIVISARVNCPQTLSDDISVYTFSLHGSQSQSPQPWLPGIISLDEIKKKNISELTLYVGIQIFKIVSQSVNITRFLYRHELNIDPQSIRYQHFKWTIDSKHLTVMKEAYYGKCFVSGVSTPMFMLRLFPNGHQTKGQLEIELQWIGVPADVNGKAIRWRIHCEEADVLTENVHRFDYNSSFAHWGENVLSFDEFRLYDSFSISAHIQVLEDKPLAPENTPTIDLSVLSQRVKQPQPQAVPAHAVEEKQANISDISANKLNFALVGQWIHSMNEHYKALQHRHNHDISTLRHQHSHDVKTIYAVVGQQIHKIQQPLAALQQQCQQQQQQINSCMHQINTLTHQQQQQTKYIAQLQYQINTLTHQQPQDQEQDPPHLLQQEHKQNEESKPSQVINDLKDLNEAIAASAVKTKKINWGNKRRKRKNIQLARRYWTLDEFPENIRKGCNDANITSFNQLQQNIMSDLLANNDSIIVSSAGSGKSIAIILSSLYKLHSWKKPAHVVFVAVDSYHVQLLKTMCDQLIAHLPDVEVFAQVRGFNSRKSELSFRRGKSIHIWAPGRAKNMFENTKSRPSLIDNLVSISLFDGDIVCIERVVTKIRRLFACIPSNVNANIVCNSYSMEMQQNIKDLVPNKVWKTHVLYRYENLKFWSVLCQRDERTLKLVELCHDNPWKQGVIICEAPYETTIVNECINKEYATAMFESDASMNDIDNIIDLYNNGSINYIILHRYSPTCLLHKIEVHKLRMLIHFDLKEPNKFLSRCTSWRYESADKKIHVLLLIGAIPLIGANGLHKSVDHKQLDQVQLCKEVEKRYNIKFEPVLSTNLSDVLITDNEPIEDTDNLIQQRLVKYIDACLTSDSGANFNPAMDKILDLNCRNYAIWASIINEMLRDKTASDIPKVVHLIVDLFTNNALNNKDNSFMNIVVDRLVIDLEDSLVKCPQFIGNVARLFAHLCFCECLNTTQCYTECIRKYKEYSAADSEGQQQNINQLIEHSVEELRLLHAPKILISKVNKFSSKY
eukprot:69759_1